ncbi:hypothetical protein QBC34DRAFT_425860 [Podospora aff. communis PSN243]|uniref:Uncharacterized protein n=1 Tax=Podospora aff. communis PSN243 TaxID=3040156 RepID=A0AAV9GLR6_9PEZI|nr:hypothetical protein QBC34DRAFT_425860 [Podospora aff. communis PSN243]
MSTPRLNFLAPARDASSSPPTGRILDRQIGARGASSSFSSNLARKPSPSPRKATPSGKSVRQMASFFETGRDSSPPLPPSSLLLPIKPREDRSVSGATSASAYSVASSATNGTKSDANAELAVKQPVFSSSYATRNFSRPTTKPSFAPPSFVGLITNEYAAEEDSLTLLNYKAYFNNRPLGRCLDQIEKKEEDAAKHRAEVEAKKKKTVEKEKERAHNLKRSATLQYIMSASTPVERLDKLMESLQALDLEAGHKDDEEYGDETLKSTSMEKQEGRRDAGELWIDEDEIYGIQIQRAGMQQEDVHPLGEEMGRDDYEDATLTPRAALPSASSVSQLPAPPAPTQSPPSPPRDAAHRPYSLNQPSEPFPNLSSPSIQSSQLGEYAGYGGLRPTTPITPASHFTSPDDMYPEPELPHIRWAQPSTPSLTATENDTDSYTSRGRFEHDNHGGRRTGSMPRMKSSDTTMTVWPSVPFSIPYNQSNSSSFTHIPSPLGITSNYPSSDCRLPIASQFARTDLTSSTLGRKTTEQKMSEIDAYLADSDDEKAAAMRKKLKAKESRGRLRPAATAGRNIAKSGINSVARATHRLLDKVDHMLR